MHKTWLFLISTPGFRIFYILATSPDLISAFAPPTSRHSDTRTITFPQRPRQQGNGILILHAYSKRGKRNKKKQSHPPVPQGSILASHVAWHRPQQNKGGWRITRRPQDETKAAFKGGQGHGGRMLVEETHQHRLSQSQRAGRPWQPAPGAPTRVRARLQVRTPLPDTANGNGS